MTTKPSEREHWEPKPSQRVWYRSRQTGDRGYLVRRDARDMIRLDQPGHEVLRRFSEAEWEKADESRPLSPATRGMVALAADRELCRALGKHHLANKDWGLMGDSERIEWMDLGPRDRGIRERLYKAIRGVLDEIVK